LLGELSEVPRPGEAKEELSPTHGNAKLI
jgi:hypothetical protein